MAGGNDALVGTDHRAAGFGEGNVALFEIVDSLPDDHICSFFAEVYKLLIGVDSGEIPPLHNTLPRGERGISAVYDSLSGRSLRANRPKSWPAKSMVRVSRWAAA